MTKQHPETKPRLTDARRSIAAWSRMACARCRYAPTYDGTKWHWDHCMTPAERDEAVTTAHRRRVEQREK